MPRNDSVGPGCPALGGVVVDDVEDDLDAGLVQRLDHGLELGHLAVRLGGGGVGLVRREEPDGVVAPVIGQPALHQRLLGHELVHRHQFHGRHAEPRQVLDHRRCRQSRVAAAQLRRHLGVAQRQAAHVRLVDQRLVVGGARLPVVGPVEVRVDHHAARHERRAVAGVHRRRITGLVGKQRRVPAQPALDGLAVGVQQQLGRVAAVAAGRVIGPVHPVAVALAGADAGQVAVPDEAVDLGQLDPGLARPVSAAGGAPEGSASPSYRHSSTRSATSENRAKFVPDPSQVAPSG